MKATLLEHSSFTTACQQQKQVFQNLLINQYTDHDFSQDCTVCSPPQDLDTLNYLKFTLSLMLSYSKFSQQVLCGLSLKWIADVLRECAL